MYDTICDASVSIDRCFVQAITLATNHILGLSFIRFRSCGLNGTATIAAAAAAIDVSLDADVGVAVGVDVAVDVDVDADDDATLNIRLIHKCTWY